MQGHHVLRFGKFLFNFSCFQLPIHNFIDPRVALRPIAVCTNACNQHKQTNCLLFIMRCPTIASARPGLAVIKSGHKLNTCLWHPLRTCFSVHHHRHHCAAIRLASGASAKTNVALDCGSACSERGDCRGSGCKGTRASVASSACSLSRIQLAAICWNPFQRGGGGGCQDHIVVARFAFTTAAGGRG